MAPAIQTSRGVLHRVVEQRPGCTEWEVLVEGALRRAVSLEELTTGLSAGDPVLLNTTATALELGTGGVEFVLARLPDEEVAPGPFPGREAGHILKLRYTPLQHRVFCVEDPAGPHHAAMQSFESLEGMPVVACELHSQAAAAAIAAQTSRRELRIALLWLDGGALPAPYSRLAARLRREGVLHTVITSGQAFGGDLEAVNVYSALAAAHRVAEADLTIVSQGPGNAGTGTEYGFSGMCVLEALHAADALGGRAVLAARASSVDPRARHQGLSSHTKTLLRCLRVPVTVPLPPELDEPDAEGHTYPRLDPGALEALAPYASALTTMGRTIGEDPLFFRAAAAAGVWAATGVGERS